MTTVREIMHSGVECINEDETAQVAARKMRDMDIGALPVCGNDDRLKGIITDRDIVVRCLATGRDPAKTRAGELTDGKVVFVDAGADLDDALTAMQEHQIRRLPVMENRRLVGMISECDLVAHLPDDKLHRTVGRIYAHT